MFPPSITTCRWIVPMKKEPAPTVMRFEYPLIAQGNHTETV